jgi:hypothetical protein
MLVVLNGSPKERQDCPVWVHSRGIVGDELLSQRAEAGQFRTRLLHTLPKQRVRRIMPVQRSTNPIEDGIDRAEPSSDPLKLNLQAFGKRLHKPVVFSQVILREPACG